MNPTNFPGTYNLRHLRFSNYEQGLANTMGNILDVQPSERLLIVTTQVRPEDWSSLSRTEQRRRRETYTMARFLQRYAQQIGLKNVEFVEYDAPLRNAVDPPAEVIERMLHYTDEGTAMILMPWDSLTHTQVRKQANKLGARIMSSPHFSAEMMENGGPMCADYSEVRQISEELAAALNEANGSTVTAPNGTELHLFYEVEAPAEPDTGDVTKPGSVSNLPAGETYRALRREGHGILRGVLLGEEVGISFENGLAKEVLTDGKVSRRVRSTLFPEGDESEAIVNRRQFAEDGTGTNRMLAQDPMRWTYSPLTAEKIYGTKHLAPGDNHTFGGTNEADYHEDVVIFNPTWTLDNGRVLMNDGELTL
ncbi:hypothetical protein ACFLQN_03200 [Candidatus Aenigmatarchaeota archaeon]